MVKIKKSCVIIAIVAMFFVMFSNIYAKDLNIYEDGEIDSNFSGNSNIKVSFKLRVKRWEGAKNTGGYTEEVTSYPPDSLKYHTYGVIFSTSPTTNYTEGRNIVSEGDNGNNYFNAVSASGVGTKEYTIGASGLSMYHNVDNIYDTRLVGISQEIINQLKDAGFFIL